MLAQNFKSAAELEISEPQRDALQKTLVLLETGKLQYAESDGNARKHPRDRTFTGHFNMRHHQSDEDCGTVCCIAGTAELIGNLKINYYVGNIQALFYPTISEAWDATPAQAATALRSYLTTGDAKWHEAIG